MGLNVYMDSGRLYEFPDAGHYVVSGDYIKLLESQGGETIGYVGTANVEFISYGDKAVEVTPISSNIQER